MYLENLINNFKFEKIDAKSNLVKDVLACVENYNYKKLEQYSFEEIEQVLKLLSEVDLRNPPQDLIEFVASFNFLEKVHQLEGAVDDEIYI